MFNLLLNEKEMVAVYNALLNTESSPETEPEKSQILYQIELRIKIENLREEVDNLGTWIKDLKEKLNKTENFYERIHIEGVIKEKRANWKIRKKALDKSFKELEKLI